jgi:hypothetical protein
LPAVRYILSNCLSTTTFQQEIKMTQAISTTSSVTQDLQQAKPGVLSRLRNYIYNNQTKITLEAATLGAGAAFGPAGLLIASAVVGGYEGASRAQKGFGEKAGAAVLGGIMGGMVASALVLPHQLLPESPAAWDSSLRANAINQIGNGPKNTLAISESKDIGIPQAWSWSLFPVPHSYSIAIEVKQRAGDFSFVTINENGAGPKEYQLVPDYMATNTIDQGVQADQRQKMDSRKVIQYRKFDQ